MKYLLTDYIGDGNSINAGSKAHSDINAILSEKGFQINAVYRHDKKGIRLIESFFSLKYIELNSKNEDVILVQWPLSISKMISKQGVLSCKAFKIAVIHDLNSLRFSPNNFELQKEEISELSCFDVVISHNEKMRQWLEQNGISTKVITLDLFDYLVDSYSPAKASPINNEYSINFSGNVNKSSFMSEFCTRSKRKIMIYGSKPGFPLPDSVEYGGSFNPGLLPSKIKESFGLIWDGDSANGGGGVYGNYTRYNNPHKLSLYMASGVPVIVWKDAAISEFVKRNNVGIAIDSLNNLDDVLDSLTVDEYRIQKMNAERIGTLCRTGYYTQTAIDHAMELSGRSI